MAAIVRREVEADGAAAAKIPSALGMVGLAVVSMAINFAAVYDTAPGFGNGSTYCHFAVVGSFFSGVTLLGAALWVADDPRGRHAVARNIIYGSIAPLLVTVILTGAALIWVALHL